ncbi:CCD25-like protein [Mya arenaria]|uniref:CCD25-like protein n=1 Tax=Mya arenaria TaxID=6604 RepID=A0ABY7FL52_MYAAR|nr:CCD25-like protein [Mya arenaria]
MVFLFKCEVVSPPYMLYMGLDKNESNKMNNVDVVFTMWGNLKKTAGMDVGQVGFHKSKDVRKVRVEKRINEIVNRLNKTKEEKFPDLRAEREDRDKKEREDQRHVQQEQRRREKDEMERKEKEREIRSYSSLMTEDKMTTNKDGGNDSDDFM